MILCKLERNVEENCYICFECENSTIFENMDNVQNYMRTKHSSCIHSKLCQIIFDKLKSIETTDSGVKYIKVLQTGQTVIS